MERKQLPSVSTALLLASGIGIIEALAMYFGAGMFINMMGISSGVFFGGGALMGEQGLSNGLNGLSSEAAVFDMEYTRWLEEHHRLMCELRAAVQEHLQENELRIFIDNCLTHYDQMLSLKSLVVKSDVFHLVSGMWKTPAERCFMWIGGFRPSDLIKAAFLSAVVV